MADGFENWMQDKAAYRWEMPRTAFWKRRPVIRHVRFILHSYSVSKHNAFWSSLGAIPTGYDRWVLYGIWHGMERSL